jgi:hypothetical protein
MRACRRSTRSATERRSLIAPTRRSRATGASRRTRSVTKPGWPTWAEETLRGVYTVGFWRAVAAVKAGDATGLEYCIRFLEADPWCFRSGYMKEQLIPAITQFKLDESMRDRLRAVVIAVVDDPRRRRDIRYYGKLARAVATADLRAQLVEWTTASDPQVRFNADRVLRGLDSTSYLPGVRRYEVT